jgi:hypothetical protein
MASVDSQQTHILIYSKKSKGRRVGLCCRATPWLAGLGVGIDGLADFQNELQGWIQ